MDLTVVVVVGSGEEGAFLYGQYATGRNNEGKTCLAVVAAATVVGATVTVVVAVTVTWTVAGALVFLGQR